MAVLPAAVSQQSRSGSWIHRSTLTAVSEQMTRTWCSPVALYLFRPGKGTLSRMHSLAAYPRGNVLRVCDFTMKALGPLDDKAAAEAVGFAKPMEAFTELTELQ